MEQLQYTTTNQKQYSNIRLDGTKVHSTNWIKKRQEEKKELLSANVIRNNLKDSLNTRGEMEGSPSFKYIYIILKLFILLFFPTKFSSYPGRSPHLN